MLTFDFHFQQFKAKELQPERAHLKYIFKLIVEEAGAGPSLKPQTPRVALQECPIFPSDRQLIP